MGTVRLGLAGRPSWGQFCSLDESSETTAVPPCRRAAVPHHREPEFLAGAATPSDGVGLSNRRGDRSSIGDPVAVGPCPLPDGGGVLPVGSCRLPGSRTRRDDI